MSNEPEEEKLDDEGQEQGFLSHLFELRDRLFPVSDTADSSSMQVNPDHSNSHTSFRFVSTCADAISTCAATNSCLSNPTTTYSISTDSTRAISSTFTTASSYGSTFPTASSASTSDSSYCASTISALLSVSTGNAVSTSWMPPLQSSEVSKYSGSESATPTDTLPKAVSALSLDKAPPTSNLSLMEKCSTVCENRESALRQLHTLLAPMTLPFSHTLTSSQPALTSALCGVPVTTLTSSQPALTSALCGIPVTTSAPTLQPRAVSSSIPALQPRAFGPPASSTLHPRAFGPPASSTLQPRSITSTSTLQPRAFGPPTVSIPQPNTLLQSTAPPASLAPQTSSYTAPGPLNLQTSLPPTMPISAPPTLPNATMQLSRPPLVCTMTPQVATLTPQVITPPAPQSQDPPSRMAPQIVTPPPAPSTRNFTTPQVITPAASRNITPQIFTPSSASAPQHITQSPYRTPASSQTTPFSSDVSGQLSHAVSAGEGPLTLPSWSHVTRPHPLNTATTTVVSDSGFSMSLQSHSHSTQSATVVSKFVNPIMQPPSVIGTGYQMNGNVTVSQGGSSDFMAMGHAATEKGFSTSLTSGQSTPSGHGNLSGRSTPLVSGHCTSSGRSTPLTSGHNTLSGHRNLSGRSTPLVSGHCTSSGRDTPPTSGHRNLSGHNTPLGLGHYTSSGQSTPLASGHSTPSGRSTPLASGHSAPLASGHNTPSGRSTPLASGHNTPSGRNTPLASGHSTPLASGHSTPSGRSTPLASGHNTPSGRNTPLASGHSTPSGRSTPLASGHSTPSGRSTPLASGHNTPSGRNTPLASGHSTPSGRNTPLASGRNTPSGRVNISGCTTPLGQSKLSQHLSACFAPSGHVDPPATSGALRSTTTGQGVVRTATSTAVSGHSAVRTSCGASSGHGLSSLANQISSSSSTSSSWQQPRSSTPTKLPIPKLRPAGDHTQPKVTSPWQQSRPSTPTKVPIPRLRPVCDHTQPRITSPPLMSSRPCPLDLPPSLRPSRPSSEPRPSLSAPHPSVFEPRPLSQPRPSSTPKDDGVFKFPDSVKSFVSKRSTNSQGERGMSSSVAAPIRPPNAICLPPPTPSSSSSSPSACLPSLLGQVRSSCVPKSGHASSSAEKTTLYRSRAFSSSHDTPSLRSLSLSDQSDRSLEDPGRSSVAKGAGLGGGLGGGANTPAKFAQRERSASVVEGQCHGDMGKPPLKGKGGAAMSQGGKAAGKTGKTGQTSKVKACTTSKTGGKVTKDKKAVKKTKSILASTGTAMPPPGSTYGTHAGGQRSGQTTPVSVTLPIVQAGQRSAETTVTLPAQPESRRFGQTTPISATPPTPFSTAHSGGWGVRQTTPTNSTHTPPPYNQSMGDPAIRGVVNGVNSTPLNVQDMKLFKTTMSTTQHEAIASMSQSFPVSLFTPSLPVSSSPCDSRRVTTPPVIAPGSNAVTQSLHVLPQQPALTGAMSQGQSSSFMTPGQRPPLSIETQGPRPAWNETSPTSLHPGVNGQVGLAAESSFTAVTQQHHAQTSLAGFSQPPTAGVSQAPLAGGNGDITPLYCMNSLQQDMEGLEDFLCSEEPHKSASSADLRSDSGALSESTNLQKKLSLLPPPYQQKVHQLSPPLPPPLPPPPPPPFLSPPTRGKPQPDLVKVRPLPQPVTSQASGLSLQQQQAPSAHTPADSNLSCFPVVNDLPRTVSEQLQQILDSAQEFIRQEQLRQTDDTCASPVLSRCGAQQSDGVQNKNTLSSPHELLNDCVSVLQQNGNRNKLSSVSQQNGNFMSQQSGNGNKLLPVSQQNGNSISQNGSSDRLLSMSQQNGSNDRLLSVSQQNGSNDRLLSVSQQNGSSDRLLSVSQQNGSSDRLLSVSQQNGSSDRLLSVSQQNGSSDRLLSMSQQNGSNDRLLSVSQQNGSSDRLLSVSQQNGSSDRLLSVSQQNGSSDRLLSVSQQNGSSDRLLSLSQQNGNPVLQQNGNELLSLSQHNGSGNSVSQQNGNGNKLLYEGSYFSTRSDQMLSQLPGKKFFRSALESFAQQGAQQGGGLQQDTRLSLQQGGELPSQQSGRLSLQQGTGLGSQQGGGLSSQPANNSLLTRQQPSVFNPSELMVTPPSTFTPSRTHPSPPLALTAQGQPQQSVKRERLPSESSCSSMSLYSSVPSTPDTVFKSPSDSYLSATAQQDRAAGNGGSVSPQGSASGDSDWQRCLEACARQLSPSRKMAVVAPYRKDRGGVSSQQNGDGRGSNTNMNTGSGHMATPPNSSRPYQAVSDFNTVQSSRHFTPNTLREVLSSPTSLSPVAMATSPQLTSPMSTSPVDWMAPPTVTMTTPAPARRHSATIATITPPPATPLQSFAPAPTHPPNTLEVPCLSTPYQSQGAALLSQGYQQNNSMPYHHATPTTTPPSYQAAVSEAAQTRQATPTELPRMTTPPQYQSSVNRSRQYSNCSEGELSVLNSAHPAPAGAGRAGQSVVGGCVTANVELLSRPGTGMADNYGRQSTSEQPYCTQMVGGVTRDLPY